MTSAAGAFLLARSSSVAEPDADRRPRGAFRFLVVNDLHHAEPACDPFFEALVAQMRGHADIAFCLIVGDLADKGRPESHAAIKRIFAGLGVPVHTVPGNHDNDVAGDTSGYAAVFPGALNYQFTHRGWQFIGLDSTEGYAWGDTHISEATLAFLDATVPKLDRKAPTAVFTHFPLADGVRLRPVNAGEVLRRLDPLNLRVAFCGHFHSRTLKAYGAGLLTTNVCCARVRTNHDGTRPEGYLVCTAYPDGRLVQEFVEFEPASDQPDLPPLLGG
ncbi:MAG: metallophosphoesterase [Opitutaceae bacterium]|nr:metallophosphoesterase [Opitutaceae bacterium]